jgi:para-aminobenzoate synthetase component I
MTIFINPEKAFVYKPEHPKRWEKALYSALEGFETYCILHSLGVNSALNFDEYEMIAGIDSVEVLVGNAGDMLQKLNEFTQSNRFSMGVLGYELRHEIYESTPKQPQTMALPDLTWFEPKWLITRKRGASEFEIYGPNPEELISQINNASINAQVFAEQFKPLISKEAYVEKVNQIKQDILEGDYYEMNYCTEFVSQNFKSSPAAIYDKLTSMHHVPFSGMLKHGNQYVICASPERFLKKTGKNILSQPMKGTVKRNPDEVVDKALKNQLAESEKDRAENIMIVDLVRSDLAKCCETGSIKVPELFGIYTYPTVHQMISTITGRLTPDISFCEIIRNTFPMGSMTGAPKRMVMERAAEYEITQRGLYSGSLGYVTADGDFDLNVIIRSLMIDKSQECASFHAGGAITFDSDPESEYEEMLLKTKVWETVFKPLSDID